MSCMVALHLYRIKLTPPPPVSMARAMFLVSRGGGHRQEIIFFLDAKIFLLDALKNNRTSKKNTKHLKFNTKHQKKRSKVTKILDGSLKNNPLQI